MESTDTVTVTVTAVGQDGLRVAWSCECADPDEHVRCCVEADEKIRGAGDPENQTDEERASLRARAECWAPLPD